MTLRLHSLLPFSRANGPGARAVVWVQGCSLGCPGCFNPETHSPHAGDTVALDDLFERIVALGDSIEGITLSGGEPLQQRTAVTELLRRVRLETKLSSVVFTGFTWDEVLRMNEAGYRSDGVSESWAGEKYQRASVEAFERSSVKQTQRPSDGFDWKRPHAPTLPRSHVPSHSATPPLRTFLNSIDVLIAGRYDATQRVATGLRGSINKTLHLLTDRYAVSDFERVPEAEVVLTLKGEMLLSGIEPLRW